MEEEERGEDPRLANIQYLTPGPSTTYYSATGALRTTLWSLKADDNEISHGRVNRQCTNHVYLISYIWYATKENKLELKINK